MTTEVEEKTEFKFSELSDRAKDKARNEYYSGDYPEYDWWDCTYEDAFRIGALLGIEISKTWHVSNRPERNGYDTIDISFSGFYSQGDGASFKGSYGFVPDALQKIAAETNDEELLRIAQELTLLQVTRRLQGLEPFSATIKTSGRGLHSNTMDVSVNSEDEDDEHNQVSDDLETEVTQLMRDFADYIYSCLEEEYDYLTSDEYVDERLSESDDLYDEDGASV